ncbi:MAG: hypothetical protein AB7F31_02650 [Parachlamydiales bacterium]
MDLLTEQAPLFTFDTLSYKEKIGRLCELVRPRFRKMLRRYALFHLIAWIVLAGEGLSLATLFFLSPKSHLAAYGLGLILLSLFSYLALRLYLQGRKPDQFEALRDLYLQSCKGMIHYQEGLADHHLALAGAACKLADGLGFRRLATYPPVRSLRRPLPFWERLLFLAYCRETLQMRTLLLQAAIDEYIKLVRIEPTHLEVHAALANAYVMLSSLYLDPKKAREMGQEETLPRRAYGEEERAAYRQAAQMAVEEFKILEAYAPNDPWVYTQLAYCYHDLRETDKEIAAYERILELCPDDLETLFKLGIRYFQRGETAKGLKVYQQLKGERYSRAESLLAFYGASR